MKYAIVGSLTALLAGAGLALAQPPDEALPTPRSATTSAEPSGPPADQSVPPGFLGLNAADPAGPYGPPPSLYAPVCANEAVPFRFWTDFDYHLWWVKENHFPPLLTSTANGTTQVLAGGDSLDRSVRNGGGATLGAWFTEYQGFGAEGSFFVMESARKDFSAGGTGAAGSPVIARPFFNALAGGPSFAPIAVPGVFAGSASGGTAGMNCDSGRFAGAGIDFIGNICCGPGSRYDFLIGYRYLTLDDRFSMTTTSSAPFAGVVDITSVTDQIDTSNHFNGANFGLRGQWYFDCLVLKATAKVAFGATDESVSLFGATSALTTGLGPQVFNGGFLARPSNTGTFHSSQFAVVPEFDFSMGYQVFDWLRVTAGYSFLYWSNVARSGDQVNLNINPLEVPSLIRPTGFITPPPQAVIHCTDFWAQGLNVGLELRY